MLKSYDEMRKIDVTPYCEERDGAIYLNWAKCVDLLHQNGAEKVFFIPVPGENGSSLIATEQEFADQNGTKNRCYETRIEIHIDDNIYFMQSPVMNGPNPVKDNSMSQQRVWNSMCRSFVKGVAIYTGLGFDLWLKEEENERKAQRQADTYHDILKVQERVYETITAIQKKTGDSLGQIAARLNKTEDELKLYLSMFKTLKAVENNLEHVLMEIR